MKISNEYVKISTGNKHIKLKNTILNKYLDTMINLSTEKVTKLPGFRCCMIKLDEPLDISQNSSFINSDFDLMIFTSRAWETEISGNVAINNYQFSTTNNTFLMYEKDGSKVMIEPYAVLGRKITAIGFSQYTENDADVLAVLDTSNYEMYINGNIIINRKDKITSNAYFKGYNINQCVHLSLTGGDSIKIGNATNYIVTYKLAELYSISLGRIKDIPEQEFIVGTDVILESTGIGEKTIKPINNKFSSLQLCNDIFLASDTYMVEEGYKYMFLKYLVYYLDGDNEKHYTDEYYYQVIELDKDGNLALKIKFERS